jgi:hypothetical protein
MAATSLFDVQATPKARWFVPTPAKLLVGVLMVQGVLFLSAHYRWFWFNERKGYTVLTTVAVTALVLLALALFVLVSQLSKANTQFRLATLLLLGPVIAVPCGWLTREIELARRQAVFVESMASHVGAVGYTNEPPIVHELTLTLGRDFFYDLTSMHMLEPDSAVLQEIKRFPRLTHLALEGKRFGDDQLSYLADCRQIQFLSLDQAQVTDTGLKHLLGLKDLQQLSLRGTLVTDNGLGQLRSFKNLGSLTLDRTRVTDGGIAQLKGLTRLQYLSLNGMPLTDAGLVHLGELTTLRHLSLDQTQITDAGLAHLADLAELELLSLSYLKVTDIGLPHLQRLKKLRYLSLIETQVTEAGVNSLQESLPQCRISPPWPSKG